MDIEDRILLNEIRKGNRDVFELLFVQYYPVLVKFSEGYLQNLHASEDLVQSFFVMFWTSSENIDIKISLKAYFFKSIKNLCLNEIRDLRVKDKHEILYIESLINSEAGSDCVDSDIFDLILEAVNILPPQMAEIFREKYYAGKKIKEIATDLNITDGAVKTQLFRARTILKEKLLKSTSIKFFL
ncbi:RNA polymerase sigma factor [Sunxiuqinia sp. sy24]|uniref:RNA polymerase sigma factor n=1 Tax=Sunxiuqinia sp. sy24 TaxID=3461495 RepID=UPI004046301A